jgi:hypothetical protein
VQGLAILLATGTDLQRSHRRLLTLIGGWMAALAAFPFASDEHPILPRLAMLELGFVMAAGIVIVRYRAGWMVHLWLFPAIAKSWIARYNFESFPFDN